MSIIHDFSRRTKLPITVNEVRDYIRNLGLVDLIVFHKVDSRPEVIKGLLYHTKDKPPYFQGSREIANIAYSKNIPLEYQRIVACKEMIHILDGTSHTATTKDSVSQLITEIVLPPEFQSELAKVQRPTVSDRSAVVLAYAVLFPRDAIIELRPLYDAGAIGVDELATLAQLPEPYVAFMMTDDWLSFIDSILA